MTKSICNFIQVRHGKRKRCPPNYQLPVLKGRTSSAPGTPRCGQDPGYDFECGYAPVIGYNADARS